MEEEFSNVTNDKCIEKKLSKKEKSFLSKQRTLFSKTISDFNLISDGDTVLCGISGGKDSLTLLHLLAHYRKYIFKNFKLSAVYVHVENAAYNIDFDAVKKFCSDLEVEFFVRNVTLCDKRNAENRCFICSLARRKHLFDFTKEFNFNKLALGHNMNDAVETLLLNQIFHGSVSSLPASLSMFDGRLKLIRPLIKFKKDQTAFYAQMFKFPQIKSQCGFEHDNMRMKMRELTDYLESLNKGAVVNLFNSMKNINDEYIVKNINNNQIIDNECI